MKNIGHPFILLAAILACLGAAKAPPKNPAFGGLTNAAQRQYGARVEMEYAAGVHKDPRTPPEDAIDGNVHSRAVFTGTPYTLTIILCDRLPIERVLIAHSDYPTEAAAKDVMIETDAGPAIEKTLEHAPSTKGKPAWQEIAVGRESRRIRVTVKSSHATKNGWGGIGEIAVLTPERLDDRFVIIGHDPAAPAFVNSVSPAKDAPAVKATLPPLAKPGEHPRLLMTKPELAALRQDLDATDRGRQAKQALLGLADAMCAGDIDFPDPKGPMAQMTSRGDAVAKRHSRIAYNCGSLGMAYAISGDAKYAKRAAEILRGYADRYEAYPEHKGVNGSDTGKVFAQRLSEAMWLIPQIIAFDYIRESGALTDTDAKLIEQKLFRTAVEFIRRKPIDQEAAERDRARADWRTTPGPINRKVMGNWTNFYNAATMLAGCVMDDRNMIDLAAADFRELLQNGIGDDGLWGEGAIGYQLFAVRAMVPGLEAAARRGIDLWNFQNGRVKFMFDSPLWYSYPDATAPGINDSGRVRFDNWECMIYDYAHLRFGDDRYAPLINRAPRQLHVSEAVYVPTPIVRPLPEPKRVAYPSMVFGNLGYAVLRGGDRYTLLKYGPHGGVHGHYDKLNLLLFAGDELGGEPRFHRYEDPLHQQWTVQTVAHNTMTVDEQKQNPAAGKLLAFEDAPGMQVMRGEVIGAYAGVLLDRTVAIADGFVIDLYRGRSQLPHTWDRTLRFNGKLTGLAEPVDAQPLGARNGYQHIKVVKRLPASTGWAGTWQTAQENLSVHVAAAKGQEVITATGPDAEHMAIARQAGPLADFGMVYALDGWQGAVKSVRLLDAGSVDVAAIEVVHAAGTTTLFAAHTPSAWSALGWHSDARVLCITQRGEEITTVLAGGTFARGHGVDLRFEAPGNYVARNANVISRWTAAK